MILTNLMPELVRLRTSMSIQWDPYRAWIDLNLERVNAIGDLAEAEGEEPAPIIRAQFVYENWMRDRTPQVTTRKVSRGQVGRDIAKTQSAVSWVKAGVIALLALGLTACGAGSGGTPSPSDDAQPHVPAISTPALSGPVVFVGDNLTLGWEQYLPAMTPAAVDVAVAGDTTEQMLATFSANVISLHPSVVVILGGTNDLRLQSSPDTAAVASMASEAAAAGAYVVLGKIPPGELSTTSAVLTQSETQAAISNWNIQLGILADDYGYDLVDYHGAMLDAQGAQNMALFDSDGIDPNAAGYAVMWGALKPLLVADGVGVTP